MNQEIIAELGVSPPRRVMLLAVLFGLGGLLVALGFLGDASFVGRVVLVVVGVLTLASAEKIRRAPNVTLQLTQEGLFQSDGTLVAAIGQFESVDRGAFAMKPSNGFTLTLSEPQTRAWVPGLWWRIGRRVGVGGTASAGAAKFMAEQIAFVINR